MQLSLSEKSEFRHDLLRLAAPIAVSALIDSAVDMADTFMLGFVSQTALSAISLAGGVLSVAVNLFFGLCTGAGILVSQYWGKKDDSAIEQTMGIAMRVGLLIGLLFSAACILLPDPVMRIFTSDAALIGPGIRYLRIVGISNLLNAYTRVYLAGQRSVERPMIGTAANTAALLLNVILNACFIFGLGFFPKMEIEGVALATVISRAAEALICLWDSRRPGRRARIRLRMMLHRNKLLTGDFLRCTLPAMANDAAWSSAVFVYSAILGHLSSEIVAANAYANTIRHLSGVLISAVCAAAGVMVGKQLGSGKTDTARRYGRRFVLLAAVLGVLAAGVILLCIPLVMPRLNMTPEARDHLRFILLYSTLIIFSQSINRMLLDAVLRAGGDTRIGLILELTVMWSFCIPAGLLAGFVFHAPVRLVYFILYLDETLKVPFVLRRWKAGRWAQNLTRENV